MTDRADNLFEQLLAEAADRRRPPVERWHPEHRGQIDIRIDRDGRWFHEGGEIRRQPMVELFASILRRDGDVHYLVTPAEMLRIEVEDVPFLVTGMEVKGAGESQQLLLTTNVGDHLLLDATHPLRPGRLDDQTVPYATVRDGLEARIGRAVYYRMAELAVTMPDGGFGIWSCGRLFPLDEG